MNDLRHEMHERFSAQDEVLAAHGDEVLLRKRPYDLAGMLAQVEPDNLHSEQDAGPRKVTRREPKRIYLLGYLSPCCSLPATGGEPDIGRPALSLGKFVIHVYSSSINSHS